MLFGEINDRQREIMSIMHFKESERPGMRGKVVVGMSGGVDSAVTAYLLKEAGYEVIGVILRTWQDKYGKDSRCCEIDAADETARTLGIPLHIRDCTEDFCHYVTEPFVDEYLSARTPNPCVECNRYVKWAWLVKTAVMLGADHVATGHYAFTEQLTNGRWTIRQAVSPEKDQTYVLYRLTQAQLARTLMPLGALEKQQVREIAEKAGIPVAHRADSQEICFVAKGSSYASYIEENADRPIPGPGHFVDEEGHVLGTHKGITHYTVGQRKGLGLPLGYHAYVREIRPKENEVVLCREEGLYSRQILCDRVNFMSIEGLIPGTALPASVRIRYHHEGTPAMIEPAGDDMVMVTFEKPVRAATPGQSAVFYDEAGRIIGGGRIISFYKD